MKDIVIDCTCFSTPRTLHQALSEALSFPDWYGHNLDALHDLLTAVSEPTRLTLCHLDVLGNSSRGFCRVLQDAALENPFLEIII